MKISQQRLKDAVEADLLTTTQADALWRFLESDLHDTPNFRSAHILYYLGGMIAIGAMTLFMTLGWERWGGGGLFAIASAYAVLAIQVTEWLMHRGWRIPAGLLASLAVATVPLAMYGAEHFLGVWPADVLESRYRDYHALVDSRWVPMEVATLLAGLWVIWRYRLPFSVMPVAVTLWYMSMDLSPMLLHPANPHDYFQQCKWLSVGFGLLSIVLAVAVDFRTKERRDFAFWLYLFGVLTFWAALTSLDTGSEWGRFGYLLVNLLLIAAGAILIRRVFVVFGAMGVAGYLGHLAYDVFALSLWFPFVLTAIGFVVIGAGIWWQKNEAEIAATLRRYLPEAFQLWMARL